MLQALYEKVRSRDPDQKEFLQAVKEVSGSFVLRDVAAGTQSEGLWCYAAAHQVHNARHSDGGAATGHGRPTCSMQGPHDYKG